MGEGFLNADTVKNSMYGKLHYLFNLLEDWLWNDA